jgi:hypothetical protein
MKLQSVRIKTNDFPDDQKQLADTLGGILNPFIDKLVIGFNKNFTVDDNLPFEFKTVDIEVDSFGIPLANGIINTGLRNFKGYICINVLDINNLGLPDYAPFLFTEVSGNAVSINKITGLNTGGSYRLVLMGIS